MRHELKSIPAGRTSVRADGGDSVGQIQFGFERPGKRMGGALGVSLVTHIAFAGLFLLALRFSPASGSSKLLLPREDVSARIVWLAEPGPGGGGGGGGNKSPEPPRKAELPGKDKITVPVLKAPSIEKPTEKPPDEEPVQQLNIPAKTLAAALNELPGAIESSGPPTSQGSGSGGGAGTGTGTGIGSGTGSGLGPGFGGGTGGGAYRPGNGVEMPRLLRQVKPSYTADAMRAKVQGIVEVECIVEPSGACTQISVVRSLDRSFGLDEEAIKAVRQWRFVPGRRLGQEVPVIVTIELTFSLR